jgi:hypothetical protein
MRYEKNHPNDAGAGNRLSAVVFTDFLQGIGWRPNRPCIYRPLVNAVNGLPWDAISDEDL